MRRRDFITVLGAAAWPLIAHAQQPAAPVIGFLNSQSPEVLADQLRAFHEGLREAGFVQSRNVAIEYRWAEGHYDRLPAMAADLVRRRVAVIATNGVAVIAAKAATTTVPIVFFAVAPDPVQAGLVASLHRPGGNVTGVNSMNMELLPKRMELLHQMVPGAKSLGFLVNPSASLANASVSRSVTKAVEEDVRAAAGARGLLLHVLEADDDRAIDDAFAKLAQLQVAGLFFRNDPLFTARSEKIAALALRYRVATIYSERAFVAAGGLLGYGASQPDQYRIGGGYVGRILKGEAAADLPVQRATKINLIVNLKTAKALGLTVPETLLATADEVIQ
jgi:putative ABC transport system substrate-binding protein